MEEIPIKKGFLSMKHINDVLLEMKDAKNILLCGGESSGKTNAIKELARELSLHHTVLVLSNHKEIQSCAFRPENVELLYKPKDCTQVGMEYLETECDYIFIDERCENIEELKNNVKQKLVIVKTLKTQEDIISESKNYDLTIEVSKDNLGYSVFLNTYKN